jgi:NAD(P)-dependent dehydrogenase (short-subunit alcohol dehydrogenase family)
VDKDQHTDTKQLLSRSSFILTKLIMANTLPTFHAKTTAEEAASALAQYITGRTVLITGVTKGGIGYENARVVAHQKPQLLILAGRSEAHNAEAEKTIKEEVPDANTRLLKLDLGSFAAIREAAAVVNSWSEPIDVLINNAAIMGGPYKKTVDGIQDTFATNHLGTFLFTNLILPQVLAAGPGSRIVNVSSRGHYRTDISYDDWNWSDGANYDKLLAYGRSKTGNILFAKSLAIKLESKGITAFSLHPGGVSTNLDRNMTDEDWETHIKNGIVDKNRQPLPNAWTTWKTVPEGASTNVVAAFDPRIVGKSGGYLVDCQVTEDPTQVRAYALDEGNGERLWKLSEELVGEKFEW